MSPGPATAPPATPRPSRAARPSPAAIASPRRWGRSSRPTSRRRRPTASATTASRISPAPSATASRPDGTHLYPAMPYSAYAGVSDEDIAALYAYFMLGVEPVDASPAAKTALPFPFNLRPLMIGWNLLYRRAWLHAAGRREPRGPARPVPGRDARPLQRLPQPAERDDGRGEFALPRRRHGRRLGRAQHHVRTRSPASAAGARTRSSPSSATATSPARASPRARWPRRWSIRSATSPRTTSAPSPPTSRRVPPIADPGLTRAAYDWTEARPVAVTAYETGNGPMQADLANATTTDGAVLYNGACATCHGIDGAGTPDARLSLAHRQRDGRRRQPGQPRPHHRRRRRPRGRQRPRLHADLRRGADRRADRGGRHLRHRPLRQPRRHGRRGDGDAAPRRRPASRGSSRPRRGSSAQRSQWWR